MDKKEIENIISDYHWMKREVARLIDLLYGLGGGGSTGGGGMTSQYGIEATLPKSSGLISKAELDEMDQRERKILDRMQKYKDIIELVEFGEEILDEPVQQVVYSCMMEGMSYRAIGKHVGVSREKVRQLRDDIISHLCQNCHFCQTWRYLKYKKSAC